MGFTAQSAERERAWERIMAAVPDSAKMREYHYALTRKPHHAGTEENYRLALYLREEYEKVPAWDQSARVPARLVEQIHNLLHPYFPWVPKRKVRNAIENLDR